MYNASRTAIKTISCYAKKPSNQFNVTVRFVWKEVLKYLSARRASLTEGFCQGLRIVDFLILSSRGSSFKEDEGTWKGNDDGKVVNNQPQRMMDDRNGLGPQGGYIGRITNDDREVEMEDNMGQVNTMIGNLRNMAIDMGSELENQNRQVDRINLKVRFFAFEKSAQSHVFSCFNCSVTFQVSIKEWHIMLLH